MASDWSVTQISLHASNKYNGFTRQDISLPPHPLEPTTTILQKMSLPGNVDSGAKKGGASKKSAAKMTAAKMTAAKKSVLFGGAKALTTSAGKVGQLSC